MKKLIILVWLCIFLNALPIYATTDYYACDAVAGLHIDQPSTHRGESAKSLYLYADGKCPDLTLIEWYDGASWYYNKWPTHTEWRYMIITIYPWIPSSGECYWSIFADGTQIVKVFLWSPSGQKWNYKGQNYGNHNCYGFSVSLDDYSSTGKIFILAECLNTTYLACDVTYLHGDYQLIDSSNFQPESLGKVKSIFR